MSGNEKYYTETPDKDYTPLPNYEPTKFEYNPQFQPSQTIMHQWAPNPEPCKITIEHVGKAGKNGCKISMSGKTFEEILPKLQETFTRIVTEIGGFE